MIHKQSNISAADTKGKWDFKSVAYRPGFMPADTVTDYMIHGIELYPPCLD